MDVYCISTDLPTTEGQMTGWCVAAWMVMRDSNWVPPDVPVLYLGFRGLPAEGWNWDNRAARYRVKWWGVLELLSGAK